MRAALFLIVLQLQSAGATIAGAEPFRGAEHLYSAEVIVPGNGDAERMRGFQEGLKEIITKIAGDPALENSAKLDPLLADARSYIRDFTFENEQEPDGKRHILRMTADAGKLNAAVRNAGLKIWDKRPEIELLLTVQDGRDAFLVAEEEPGNLPEKFLHYRIAHAPSDGYDHRQILRSIAEKRGLTIHLPKPSDLQFKQQSMDHHRLICLFRPDATDGNCVRYRVELVRQPPGLWRLESRIWALSPDLIYVEVMKCFSSQSSEATPEAALRESIDAVAKWARGNQDASQCGLPVRF
jgi:hypothetical protein